MGRFVTLPPAVSSEVRLWARAHGRATLLADVSTTMSGSLNVRRSALRLIGLLRPAFADWVLLGLPGPDGDTELFGGADDSELRRVSAAEVAALPTLARMLRSGQTELLHVDAGSGRADGLDGLVPHAGLRQQAHQLKPADVLGLPLLARGSVIGFLVLVRAQGAGFAVRDISLAEEIARRSALSLDAARLFRSRLDTVAAVRAGLGPAQPVVPGRFRCAVASRSAGEEVRASSVHYDVDTLDGDLVLFAGAATGHGIEAATAALRIRQALRTASRFTRQPDELIAAADSAGGAGRELAVAWVDCAGQPPMLRAATAGPVLLVVQRSDGSLVDPAGQQVPLRPGDVLLCVTGPIATGSVGIGSGDPATDRAALLALVHRYRGTGAQVLVEAIEQHTVERLGEQQQDFLAVAVELQG